MNFFASKRPILIRACWLVSRRIWYHDVFRVTRQTMQRWFSTFTSPPACCWRGESEIDQCRVICDNLFPTLSADKCACLCFLLIWTVCFPASWCGVCLWTSTIRWVPLQVVETLVLKPVLSTAFTFSISPIVQGVAPAITPIVEAHGAKVWKDQYHQDNSLDPKVLQRNF